jgi:hypothetical protein
MASRYAQLGDCEDPSVTVSQSHLDEADTYVDGALWARGINPADVTLPNAQLKTLAVAWAMRIACIKGAVDEHSPLKDKAKEYLKNAEVLESQITRESLGLADTTTGSGSYGTVTLGRG